MASFRKTHVQDEWWCIPPECFDFAKYIFNRAVASARCKSVSEDDSGGDYGDYLKRADKTKKQEDFDGVDGHFLAFGTCGMRGWRATMEDDHCCITEFDGDPSSALFTIFDGHGGRAVASFCAAKVADTFRQTEEYSRGDYKEALVKTYLSLDEQMLQNWPSCFDGLSSIPPSELDDIDPDPYDSYPPGCTATSVFIKNNRLYVANAGDCRAVLWRAGEEMRLTEDHTPLVYDELVRIRRAGGFIEDGRVNGCLAMTRAIGDFRFKSDKTRGPEEQMVTAKPEMRVEELTYLDDFLVLGCDGVWETMTTEKVMKFVDSELAKERQAASRKLSNVAASLFDKVIAPDLYSTNGLGLDNMTCVIIDLRRSR